MLNLHSRFKPNKQEVAAKVMDGEAIFINLSTGVYYSMDKVGALTWELIDSGMKLEEIVSSITNQYDVSREQAQADLERLASELLQEKLVLESGDEAQSGRTLELGSQEKLPYSPPELNIYRDMESLLALDPPMPDMKDIPWKDPDEK